MRHAAPLGHCFLFTREALSVEPHDLEHKTEPRERSNLENCPPTPVGPLPGASSPLRAVGS